MIDLIKVKDKTEGNLKAHEILKKVVNKQTLLGLSGGTTPNYESMIVKPADVLPGAAFILDERWTDDEEGTNLSLMKKVGLNTFFVKNNVDFFGLPLQGSNKCECDCECDDKEDCGDCGCDEEDCGVYDASAVVEGYSALLKDLFKKYSNKVAVVGVGSNVHTVGIFPNSEASKSDLLVAYDKVEDKYPERITTTFKALGKFDTFIILMFGEDKRGALEIILNKAEDDLEKYPAVFYRKTKAKCFLITDLDVK